MIKKNLGKLIIGTIVILLPMVAGIILWDKLPDTMATHFGASGNADGFSSKAFAVFGLPLILAALQWLGLIITAKDPKNKEQSPKAINMGIWIMPVLSIVVSAVMYSLALGLEFSVEKIIPAVLGISFILIGNYLPKCRQNSTLGIKITWTLADEENWNRTHRIAGITWVIGGIVMLAGIFLPIEVYLIAFIPVMLLMVLIPTVYSYFLYKKKGNKEEVKAAIKEVRKNNKVGVIITAIVIPLILVFVAVLMLTGDVNVELGEESFEVKATYWDDIEVDYDDIDSIEYRESCDGTRVYGYGSARLLLGMFENEEFGKYTRCTYTGKKPCIVLEADGEILVIGLESAEETKALYNDLSKKIG